MRSDEIREAYLSFFEERDHLRQPSSSLVPPAHDTSVLLTTAGMQQFKPFFAGEQKPPHHRATSCQKCFRAVDIEVVGTTTRHLTCFEMLGNFSFGDYFKEGAVEFAWDLSLNGLGFEPESIWVTVHEGDDTLGLGPDEEAIDAWLAIGVPRERIMLLPSSENFWASGPVGPCGPCSELYLDRGPQWGTEDDLPGGDNERFLEFWNLVFMQYNRDDRNVLTPLPQQNIDTGLGLERQALIQQDVDSVFDTDLFVPLMELGRELATREPEERALRILADHTRGMSFLIADGVVPSNEERGYVLRKVMRRAIHQGRRLGVEGPFLVRYAERVRELMGKAYPELVEQRDAVDMWLGREEEAFGRTIDQGERLLEEMIDRARDEGREGIGADNAFLLHDTYGFPFELTSEIAAEHGLGTDAQGFEDLMEQQRTRARQGAGRGARDTVREQVAAFAEGTPPTEFTGYTALEQQTEVIAASNGFAKLAESPFYAEGGGQIADVGEVGGVPVTGVVRLGDDQVLLVDGALEPGQRVTARVSERRRPTECNHTATHLLHAALREALGSHVRQAGSYVGPDKLRFDFTHGAPLTREQVVAIEDRVNAEILANRPVRAITTTLDEARALGAMALFGEKYGDVVRMVSIGDGDWSRELCGGTHVRSTAEIGVFKIVQETSSAANVRRIEALTGPEAVSLLLRHDRQLAETAAALRTQPERTAEQAAALVAERKAARKQQQKADAAPEVSTEGAVDVAGVQVLVRATEGDPKALPSVADKLLGRLGDTSVVVLGIAGEGKVALVATATPAAVARGVRSGEIVRQAAAVVGGGGGGKDTMAQAGGRDPGKLPDALETARAAIAAALA